jgi:hypothetical protein
MTGPVRAMAAKLRRAFSGAFDAIKGAGRNVLQGIGQGIGQGITNAIGSAIRGAIQAAEDWTKQYIDTGDELLAFSSKTGLAVEAIQEWRYAAEQSDTAAGTFNAGFLNFSKAMALARTGTGKLATTLKKVAPDLLKQLKATNSSEEAFTLYASAIEEVEDPGKRAALAAAAFGGASKDMLPMLTAGVKRLKELREEKRKDGVMSTDSATKAGDLDEQMGRLNNKWTAFKLRVGEALANAFGPLLTKLGEWYDANKDIIGQKIVEAIDKVAKAVGNIDWDKVREFVKKAWDAVKNVVSSVADAIEKVGGLKNAFLILAGVAVIGPLTNLLTLLTSIGGAALGAARGVSSALGAGSGAAAGAGAAGAGAAGAGRGAGKMGRALGALGAISVIGSLASWAWDSANEDKQRRDDERANSIGGGRMRAELDRRALESGGTPHMAPTVMPPMSPSSMAAPRLGSSTMDLVGRIQASQPQEITVTVKSEPGTNAEITQKPKASNVKAGVRKVGTGAL